MDFDVYNLPFNRHLFLRHIKAKLLKRRPNHVGPIKDPWDVLIDPEKNVLKHREQLCNDARTSSVSHWGPNCATFTRAREIEMPGVPKAPKPLRSNAYPEGLPEVLDQARLNVHGKNRQRVIDDTIMANLAADECLLAHRAGNGFTLEHPGRSIALNLDSWVRLMQEPCVFTSNALSEFGYALDAIRSFAPQQMMAVLDVWSWRVFAGLPHKTARNCSERNATRRL